MAGRVVQADRRAETHAGARDSGQAGIATEPWRRLHAPSLAVPRFDDSLPGLNQSVADGHAETGSNAGDSEESRWSLDRGSRQNSPVLAVPSLRQARLPPAFDPKRAPDGHAGAGRPARHASEVIARSAGRWTRLDPPARAVPSFHQRFLGAGKAARSPADRCARRSRTAVHRRQEADISVGRVRRRLDPPAPARPGRPPCTRDGNRRDTQCYCERPEQPL